MNRRDFMKTLAAAGLCAGQPMLASATQTATLEPYRGNFFSPLVPMAAGMSPAFATLKPISHGFN